LATRKSSFLGITFKPRWRIAASYSKYINQNPKHFDILCGYCFVLLLSFFNVANAATPLSIFATPEKGFSADMRKLLFVLISNKVGEMVKQIVLTTEASIDKILISLAF